jgi:hypothetical protein
VESHPWDKNVLQFPGPVIIGLTQRIRDEADLEVITLPLASQRVTFTSAGKEIESSLSTCGSGYLNLTGHQFKRVARNWRYPRRTLAVSYERQSGPDD